MGWQSLNPARIAARDVLGPLQQELASACAPSPQFANQRFASENIEYQQSLINTLQPLCFRPITLSGR